MKNLIKYTIKNLNKEKVLKEILKVSNITNIKILEQEMTFCVSVKNSKKIDKILDSKGAKILNKKRVGTIQFLKSSVFRLGVLIPIIVFLFAAIVSNLFVFNYQITGNDLVSSNEIINILKEQNVSGIKYKKDINISNLENAILKIEQVSLVSIIFYGNTLIINIKEKVYNEEYVQQGKFLPLKAEFNGIITEISLIQGTLLVKEGQL